MKSHYRSKLQQLLNSSHNKKKKGDSGTTQSRSPIPYEAAKSLSNIEINLEIKRCLVCNKRLPIYTQRGFFYKSKFCNSYHNKLYKKDLLRTKPKKWSKFGERVRNL